jgi:hypothetical protein
MLRQALAALLLLTAANASGGAPRDSAVPAASLARLAAAADLVVLAQVRDTDYAYRREFPVEGSAFLRVLLVYKTDRPLDVIEVYEQGLHEHECYFPNPTVFEEGRRYLLFLHRDPVEPDRYRGLPQGCALDVLVARDSRYVLRLPASGIALSDPLAERAAKFDFADVYALENDDTLPPGRRDALLASGLLEPHGTGYIYTSGIALTVVRGLLGEAALAGDRRQKRVD